jgi:hypothetical protein
MLKDIFTIKSKTKGYTDKMLALVEKMNTLQESGVSIETLFIHLNQYLDLFVKDKNLKENIENINAINEEKEQKKIKELNQKGVTEIALYFKNNGFSYCQTSTSGSELFEIFDKSEEYKSTSSKFKQGIHKQDEKLANITNNFYKHLSYYHLNGDSIVSNLSIPVGYQEKLTFGIPSEFIHFSDGKNVYKHLYSITQTIKNGFFANEYSILMLCSKFGMANEIEYLIKKGCNIHYTAPDGKKALDLYNPSTMTSPEQASYIRSLLDGSYKNGFYVAQYEQTKLESSIEKSKNNTQSKLKL